MTAWMLTRSLFFITVAAVCTGGCTTPDRSPNAMAAIREYECQQAARPSPAAARDEDGGGIWASADKPADRIASPGKLSFAIQPAYCGVVEEPASSRPASGSASRPRPPGDLPEGYWRRDLWHQMGHEAKSLGSRDFWRGFKTSFWDVENALVLTATMGASIAIRETGVDDTVRNRTHGSNTLGDFDEPVQILGHPGFHFAGTGVLWLSSALTKNAREHEVAKALTQALAVNGVSTILLKVAANTRTPDEERYGWPSGHTSSAFTAAAVLNEYYGPWVGVPSLALAGLVGYQRLDSRVHDFSDVVFGGMMGYIIGTSIARDDKMRMPELFGMTVLPFSDPQTGSAGLALYKRIK
ncbi:PAP2 superfamily protein [Phycisphaerae bacterium RAS1]|nr:PAP2 superfamily protein [Phycisphaerae bacterium RAS1]